jgi:hypothetical protein
MLILPSPLWSLPKEKAHHEGPLSYPGVCPTFHAGSRGSNPLGDARDK